MCVRLVRLQAVNPLGGASLTVVPILVSCSFWLTGAYRPEALDDSILQMLYDMAWLLIDLGYMVTTVQICAIGVALMSDEREVPLAPKWFAWHGEPRSGAMPWRAIAEVWVAAVALIIITGTLLTPQA